MEEMVKIPLKEYRELKRHREVDEGLLLDIAEGMKDILKGNIEEV